MSGKGNRGKAGYNYPPTHVRLSPEDKATLRRLAEQEDLSMSQWLRRAIRQAEKEELRETYG